MLKHLAICLTVTLLLLTTLLPAQAVRASGCPSTQVADDVCHAPGTAAPSRAPAGKPCLTCVLPGAIVPPELHGEQVPLGLAGGDLGAPGRVVPPDRRPPRA